MDEMKSALRDQAAKRIRERAAGNPTMRDDGRVRTDKEQFELDRLIASVFSDTNGEQVLKYLRSITIEAVSGPALSADALRHLEGQRYLYAIIQAAIDRVRGK